MDTRNFTYSISGKVLPERAVVCLPLVVHTVASKEGKMPEGWQVTVSIVNSQVAVTITTPQAVPDLNDMREKVEAIVRFCVDTLGFLLACGYDIELTQVMTLNPIAHQVFGVDVQGVREKESYTEDEINARFQQILQSPAHKQQALRRALVDFREAIRSYEDTPFFCFRAIEDLRQCFVSGKDDDVKNTWNAMVEKLQVEKDAIDYVWGNLRPLATIVRHGASAETDQDSRIRMLRVTWDLINRFVSADIQGPNAAELDTAIRP